MDDFGISHSDKKARFCIEQNKDNQISLKSSDNNKYLSASNDKKSLGSQPHVQSWETFSASYEEDGSVTLKSHHHTFLGVTPDSNKLTQLLTEPKDAQKLYYELANTELEVGRCYYFKTATGNYLARTLDPNVALAFFPGDKKLLFCIALTTDGKKIGLRYGDEVSSYLSAYNNGSIRQENHLQSWESFTVTYPEEGVVNLLSDHNTYLAVDINSNNIVQQKQAPIKDQRIHWEPLPQGQPNPFVSLNDDVLRIIVTMLQFGSVRDVISFLRSSKAMYGVVPSLITELDLRRILSKGEGWSDSYGTSSAMVDKIVDLFPNLISVALLGTAPRGKNDTNTFPPNADISALKRLRHLKHLIIEHNFTAFSVPKLDNLETLKFIQGWGVDLDKQVPNLRSLSEDRVNNDSELLGLKNLEDLSVAYDRVSEENIAVLAKIEKLKFLSITSSYGELNINMLQPLSSKPNLTHLYLHGKILDLNGLKEFSSLQFLSLSSAVKGQKNGAYDLAPLLKLTSLQILEMHDTTTSQQVIEDFKSMHPNKELRVVITN